MATISTPHAAKTGLPRPSGRTVLLLLIVIGIIWAALSVQAAILSDRQDTSSAKLQQQISALQTSGVQATNYPMDVSDQAKAQAYDASLPPATTEPVKDITITATDNVILGLAKGIDYHGWSFGGTIPAQPLHVRQGDTVHFTLTNNSTMGHGIDFHAAQIDPGANYKVVLPGQSFSFDWTANVPGVFMFHCSSAPVIEHIANGMFGAIVVDPATPLPSAREYVLVQSEFYVGKQNGIYTGDVNKMLADTPDYVVFNGMINQYKEHPLTANPGELVRLYIVNAGPNHTSAFHVIGAIMTAYPDGNPANKLTGVQTYNIPPGGAAMFEMTMSQPGTYTFVTHEFADASHGALGVIQVGQPAAAAPAAPAAQSANNTATGATTIQLTATDNAFSQKTITASAGQPITVTFANKGSAIHNFHVKGLQGTDGKDVQTPLVDPGKNASITFTPAKAGTYTFICDVHPAEMTGTLTVK